MMLVPLIRLATVFLACLCCTVRFEIVKGDLNLDRGA